MRIKTLLASLAFLLVVVQGTAHAQYQLIPDYQGNGAGFNFRTAINARFSGQVAISPLIVGQYFASLPAEQNGLFGYCADCSATSPCTGGGGGEWYFGEGGIYNCSVNSYNAAVPGAIGGTTPAAGTFTTLNASSIPSPGPIGGTAPNTGNFTLLADAAGVHIDGPFASAPSGYSTGVSNLLVRTDGTHSVFAEYNSTPTLLSFLAPTGIWNLAGIQFYSGGAVGNPVSQIISKIGRIVFTSSGTYTPTSGMLFAQIECLGGGGGGTGLSGISGDSLGAPGGGAGGYSRVLVTAATVGASQTVTVGGGGSAGPGGGGAGGNGSSSSVGSLCVANGGSGGGSTTWVGGSGGTVGTGDLAMPGSQGGSGEFTTVSTVQLASGNGAGSVFGGGVAGLTTTTSGCVNGNAGSANTGVGGGGASCYNTSATAAGGVGKGGIVIITEFYQG
jgi:hypothetical protein